MLFRSLLRSQTKGKKSLLVTWLCVGNSINLSLEGQGKNRFSIIFYPNAFQLFILLGNHFMSRIDELKVQYEIDLDRFFKRLKLSVQF